MQKLLLSISFYIVICNIAIFAATREYEQKQPIGLLIVGMVFIPIIITIYGGLPLNFMREWKLNATTTDHDEPTS